VGGKPIADRLGLANIGKLTIRLVFVFADQDVHPRSFDLGKCLAHLPKFIASEGDGLDRRHHDLGNANAVRVAVEKENGNCPACWVEEYC
jgi:hypothetical protein